MIESTVKDDIALFAWLSSYPGLFSALGIVVLCGFSCEHWEDFYQVFGIGWEVNNDVGAVVLKALDHYVSSEISIKLVRHGRTGDKSTLRKLQREEFRSHSQLGARQGAFWKLTVLAALYKDKLPIWLAPGEKHLFLCLKFHFNDEFIRGYLPEILMVTLSLALEMIISTGGRSGLFSTVALTAFRINSAQICSRWEGMKIVLIWESLVAFPMSNSVIFTDGLLP